MPKKTIDNSHSRAEVTNPADVMQLYARCDHYKSFISSLALTGERMIFFNHEMLKTLALALEQGSKDAKLYILPKLIMHLTNLHRLEGPRYA